jgi:hypothetical protein
MLVGCRAPAGKGSGRIIGSECAFCGTAPAWGVEFNLIKTPAVSPASAHALVPIALVTNATVNVAQAGAWALPGRAKLCC